MDYKNISYSEFQKFSKLENINLAILNSNNKTIKKIFNNVFLINSLRNRYESEDFFDTDFDFTFSLLIESMHSLCTGHTRASLLLLRSSLEASTRFILLKERKKIKQQDPNFQTPPSSFSFKETLKSLRRELKIILPQEHYPEYFATLDTQFEHYENLSSVTHANSITIPLNINEYIEDIENKNIANPEIFFKVYTNTLKSIVESLLYSAREELSKIDTYQLVPLLKVVYKSNKSFKLCERFKQTNVS